MGASGFTRTGHALEYLDLERGPGRGARALDAVGQPLDLARIASAFCPGRNRMSRVTSQSAATAFGATPPFTSPRLIVARRERPGAACGSACAFERRQEVRHRVDGVDPLLRLHACACFPCDCTLRMTRPFSAMLISFMSPRCRG